MRGARGALAVVACVVGRGKTTLGLVFGVLMFASSLFAAPLDTPIVFVYRFFVNLTRGDTDCGGKFSINDTLQIARHIIVNTSLCCQEAVDVDMSGVVDLTDVCATRAGCCSVLRHPRSLFRIAIACCRQEDTRVSCLSAAEPLSGTRSTIV